MEVAMLDGARRKTVHPISTDPYFVADGWRAEDLRDPARSRSIASAAAYHAQVLHSTSRQTVEPVGRRHAAERMRIRGGSEAPPTGAIAFAPFPGD
jgi:hypothetical protein